MESLLSRQGCYFTIRCDFRKTDAGTTVNPVYSRYMRDWIILFKKDDKSWSFAVISHDIVWLPWQQQVFLTRMKIYVNPIENKNQNFQLEDVFVYFKTTSAQFNSVWEILKTLKKRMLNESDHLVFRVFILKDVVEVKTGLFDSLVTVWFRPCFKLRPFLVLREVSFSSDRDKLNPMLLLKAEKTAFVIKMELPTHQAEIRSPSMSNTFIFSMYCRKHTRILKNWVRAGIQIRKHRLYFYVCLYFISLW